MTKDQRSDWLPGPWLYVLNQAGIPLVPLHLAYQLALPIGDLVHLLWESKRQTTRRNYARILGCSPDDPRVGRMARECFRQFSLYVAEAIHVQGWDTDSIFDRLEIVGEENFGMAEAHDRGIIFVSAHMGSPEVAASVARLRGYKITAVSERLRPQFLMDWAEATRASMGITLLPATGSGIKLLRALRRKEMVAMVVDVGIANGGGVPVTFFGHHTIFPVGPARLARLSGAPIVFGLGLRRAQSRFLAHISPPILSSPEADPEEDARRITQQIVDIFEGFVRRYPEQWYCFREMWPHDAWPLREQ